MSAEEPTRHEDSNPLPRNSNSQNASGKFLSETTDGLLRPTPKPSPVKLQGDSNSQFQAGRSGDDPVKRELLLGNSDEKDSTNSQTQHIYDPTTLITTSVISSGP